MADTTLDPKLAPQDVHSTRLEAKINAIARSIGGPRLTAEFHKLEEVAGFGRRRRTFTATQVKAAHKDLGLAPDGSKIPPATTTAASAAASQAGGPGTPAVKPGAAAAGKIG